jgi:hypothetical protein
MIPALKFKNIKVDISEHEKAIDNGLSRFFCVPGRKIFTFPLKYNIDQIVIDTIIEKYTSGGWVIKQFKGCDDRPCAEPYNKLEFHLPF